MNGISIKNTQHFLELLKTQHSGAEAKFTFYRAGKLKEKKLRFLPKAMESSSSYEIIYASVKSGSNELRTIITKPKGNGSYLAVLLVGGVGCYSIDNPTQLEIQSMKLWSDSLTRSGFVTMRVEKTGMGDSRGIPCSACDFNTEKQGYLDALKQLKSLAYVNNEKVFVAGFSIGGVIAPLLAQTEKIKGMIVYGTVGRNWLEYEMENSFRQQKLENYPPDSIDRFMRADYIRLYGLYVEKKTPEQILREHPETADHLFQYPMRIEYFQQVADINIGELWMKTQTKVLALHGASDFVSSASEHQLIAEIVNRFHPGNATYMEIPQADHWSFLTESERASLLRLETKLNPSPLIAALDWLKKLN